MLRGVAQPPPRQNATDTINTLCGRLSSATLLEDRRGAILGLRSFAKDYPASVASGALRGLISTLTKDVDDVDTGKLVLETLLMLFNPNSNSPEASDDVALWLADEFSQHQEHMTVLLDLLEAPDFYSRLYSLQLLSAISSARPQRMQECVLSAPLGTTRLVAVLDDPREAIRSAGLLLLNDLTTASLELQKLVAFENAFDRIFNLIQSEGSLTHGGIVVQDCLALLANLLDLNASNQSLFRETGFVPKLAQLLRNAGNKDGDEDIPQPNSTTDKNLWGLLAVLRMFLIPGNLGTQANQAAFEKHQLLQLALELGFNASASPMIRAEALLTCADMIRGNGKIQERFAHNKVSSTSQSAAAQLNGGTKEQANGVAKVYVIDALLDLTLTVPSLSVFDARYAACECIQAYFHNHTPIRLHFLRRAIDGHTSGEDETSNILSILIHGSDQKSDPYRSWFAARLTFLILFEDSEAKNMAMAIAEGDASKGEEVITCIQSMTANLITALQTGEDDRICIGYLMILCGWLFEDVDAVNDLLGEGSTVQSLIQATIQNDKSRGVVQGLCAFLLGILYEFSTKDSPIPRRTLQPLLVSGLGRERFVAKITLLRENTLLRDFEVQPQKLSAADPGAFPPVFFDQVFVNFFKDNFSRIIRALDKDPGIEVARLHEGIDRDLVDSLRSQLEGKTEALDEAKSGVLTLERKLGQEQADHKRSQETFNAELARIKNINDALQRGHEAESEKLEADHRVAMQGLREEHARDAEEFRQQVQAAKNEGERRLESRGEEHAREVESMRKELEDWQTSYKQSNETIEVLQRTNDSLNEAIKTRDGQVESAKRDKQLLEEDIEMRIMNTRKLEDQIKDQETQLEVSREREVQLEKELKEKDEARGSVQTELDDLLMVLSDLEEKRTRDKKQLKELGAEVSDIEEEDEEEEADGDEEGEGEEEKEEDDID